MHHAHVMYLILFFCHALGLVMVNIVGSGSFTIFLCDHKYN
jgi:hypothetical protein